MRLDEDQIRQLAELLAPLLEAVPEGQSPLARAFRREPHLMAIVDAEASTATEPIQFTQALLNRLNDDQMLTHSGEQALISLLKSLQHSRAAQKQAAQLQPFIEALQAEAPPRPQAVTVPVRQRLEPDLSPPPRRSTPRTRDQTRKKRRLRLFRRLFKPFARVRPQFLALILIVAIALPIAAITVLTNDADARVQRALATLDRIENSFAGRIATELTLTDYELLRFSVRQLTSSLALAKQRASLVRIFGFVDPNLSARYETLSAAENVALAGENVLDGLQPILAFLIEGDKDERSTQRLAFGERFISLLEDQRNQFERAAALLDRAQASLKTLDAARQPASLAQQIRDVTSYYEQVQAINQVLLNAPQSMAAIFGLNLPEDYLIISPNNDALRPSGGHVSTFGWVRMRRARITDLGYSPTTSLAPNPPSALADMPEIPTWWLQFPRPIYAAWNGSWFADFPSTAQLAAQFYDGGQNPRAPVDGVISMDNTAFEALLALLGSVTVPGYDETVTPANFRQALYMLRSEHDASAASDAFRAALYRQILLDLQNLPQQHSGKLLSTVLRMLQEKHMMIFFREPALNDIVNLLGWSGAQTPGTDDYLMVADTNISGKANRAITRQIAYDVEILSDGGVESRLSISYDYAAAVAQSDPAIRPEYASSLNYFNILQAFVPKGSTLVKTDNLPTEARAEQTDALTRFVAPVEVVYNGTARFQFVYTAPSTVKPFGTARRYRLLLQKQPGARADAVNVKIRLPEGANVISASPALAPSSRPDQQVLEFRLQLEADQLIEVVFE